MPQHPPRRHTAEELQAFSRDELLRLVLELQERNALLEASEKPESSSKSSASGDPKDEEVADDPERLERGISNVPANVEAARQLRAELAEAVEGIVLRRQSSTDGKVGRLWQQLTHASFSLPDLSDADPGLEKYILSKLIAAEYQKELEDDSVLNWWVPDLGASHQLHVLRTSADGNCLLHATLLAMWGLHDTHMVGTSGLSSLRAAMSRLFSSSTQFMESLRRRWELQIVRDNTHQCVSSQDGESRALHVDVSAAQLSREWSDMVDIANRPNAFLDSVHVFALAHALRRPILVLASAMQKDPFGVPLTPLFFQGVYLPLERHCDECCKRPLLLCFRDAHFMPLVPKKAAVTSSVELKVPIVDCCEGAELPLRFASEEELGQRRAVLKRYLDIEWDVALPKAKLTGNIVVCRQEASHPLVDQMMQQFVERGRGFFKKEQQADDGSKKRKAGAASLETGKRPSPDKSPEASDKDQEADAAVNHAFEVRLPKGVRPGDRSYFRLPAGCTDREQINFIVPKDCYEGDCVKLNAKFAIKGHCIRTFREVTGLARGKAVQFLTRAYGDPNAAAQLYFEQAPNCDD
eukprot:TRINITY_DN27683_c0_g1_i1.p1 TRINITY_DN27683_c0_g1~~TRINITY_DN27683_c0_g1_i1.p1  ORF type:complete len:596 (-),score=177.65 TRINITY_DN27683_c0_g1_i1:120-1859(-)